MADFTVNAEELESTAKQLENLANDYAQCMDRIINKINSMGEWSGSAREEFFNKATSMRGAMAKYYEVLTSYVTTLREIAAEYLRNEGLSVFDASQLDDSNLIH